MSGFSDKVKHIFSATEASVLKLQEATGAVLQVLKPTAKEREFLINPKNILDPNLLKNELEEPKDGLYNSMDVTTGGIVAKVAQHLPCFTHQPNIEGTRKPSAFHWFITAICCPVLTCIHFTCPSTCCAKCNSTISQCHLYSIPWGCNCCLCLNTQPKTLACSNLKLCQLFRRAYISSITLYGVIIAFLVFIIYSSYDSFVSKLLEAFESLSDELAVILFLFLFTLASFPLVWGYVLLNLAAGYKFGVLWGVITVMFCVTIGLTMAHKISKRFCLGCIMGLLRRRSNFDQIEAILKVLDSPSGLKIIALTRLTPIPFGLQNGLFSASNIETRHYVAASNIGLLPTQILNCYMGSTFHSANDIINSGGSPGSYMVFVCQLCLGLLLMAFVIRHARRELSRALNHSTEAEKTGLDDKGCHSLDEVKITQPISSASSTNLKALKEAKPLTDMDEY